MNFEFPEHIRDKAEAALSPKQPVRSVRRPVTSIVEAPEKTVPVTQPPVTPTASATAQSISLPSNFHYYSFKDLYVEPLRVYHLAKLAAAHEKQSLQLMAEVVDTVLFTPSGETGLAFKLSSADFRAVLLWLRLNTFAKKPMIMTATCQNEEHHVKVNRGEMPPESLKVSASITTTNAKVTELTNAPDPDIYKVEIDGNTINLRPEIVADTIAFLDRTDYQDVELQYMARIAAALDVPVSFDERLQLANKLSPDDALLVYEFLGLTDVVGVTETVEAKCAGCGASQSVLLTVDAPCFLSS